SLKAPIPVSCAALTLCSRANLDRPSERECPLPAVLVDQFRLHAFSLVVSPPRETSTERAYLHGDGRPHREAGPFVIRALWPRALRALLVAARARSHGLRTPARGGARPRR